MKKRITWIVLVALFGAALCWRMIPRSFDSLLPDEQGSLLVYYMIGTEACEELMTYIQEHGINEIDDAAQKTSGETVSRDQQVSIGENEAAEITDSQKAEDTFLSNEERYAGMPA